jgi:hypothetical protein
LSNRYNNTGEINKKKVRSNEKEEKIEVKKIKGKEERSKERK